MGARGPAPKWEHGTEAGYYAHRRAGTLAESGDCGCRAAATKRKWERRARLGQPPVIRPFPHGTVAGYERHRREGSVDESDDCGCRAAKNVYQVQQRRKRAENRGPAVRTKPADYVKGSPSVLRGGSWQGTMIKKWVPDA